MSLASEHPLVDGRTGMSPLVRALRGDRPETTPVWFMRQAGRSLPEYRAVREGTTMLQSCLIPELASEITMQPVRRHGVDAAILFSDIVIPLLLAGIDVEIVPGRGPVIADPIRSAGDLRRLRPIDPPALDPIRTAVALTVDALGSTPLIGFAGAPFTLASYLVEGGPSKDQGRARSLMLGDPETWSTLMRWCAEVTGAFLHAQVAAGASVAQLFDSWVGSLSREQYEHRVAPFSALALTSLDGIAAPRTHFGVGSGEVLDLMATVGVDAVGVDWRIPLHEASRRLGGTVPVQGNIDPAVLAAPWPVVQEHVERVLESGLAAPAHVVNLGHGVPPETDPDVLTRIVALVHGDA